MDILQVNKFYPPVIGGIETAVGNLATGLADRDHDVRAVVAREQGLGQTDRREGVGVKRCASLGTVASTPIAPGFPLAYARRAGGADVVHHHLPNPLGVLSAELPVGRSAHRIVTYHSDIVRQQRALRLYRPLLDRFLDSVDRIVVTSPRLLEHSEILGPYRDAAEVIPLSVDLDRFAPGAADPADLPVDATEPFVLFVGRLAYYKGVEFLIEAMRGVDAQLVVVGDGPRRAALEDRARERGLQDCITFLGSVSTPALHACYDAAAMLVLPSIHRSEAFGIVQLEAMAHGTPVVNTDLPTGVPWVSRDGETGLTVPARDADALADAINRLLADSDRRGSYGRQARRRVEAEFGRDTMLDRYETLYRSL